ncbi:phenazine biosynthesis protein [Stagonosporopsis vannaccii]|nr:phenazine biosynthesis protein [Stagonosporopsis vannaccii]
MQLPFTTVDVFTTTPYGGNPLAIVRVPSSFRSALTEEQRQKIAKEFNLSETTFIYDPEPGSNSETVDFDIFTPLAHLAFAGHPTIGTAIYAASTPSVYPNLSQLKTMAGTIPFSYEKRSGRASVEVPHAFRIHRQRLPHPFPGQETNGSGSVTVPLVSIVKGMAFNLVSLASVEALRLPNKGLLPVEECYRAEHLDQGSGWDVGYTGTFYYTELGPDPEDHHVRALRTRSIGSREDPGTGSASCALCCYLAVRSGARGVQKFHLTQGVEMGRRCDIYVSVKTTDDGEGVKSVELSGTAVRVMEGVLTIE